MRKFIFWEFPRSSWQYELVVTLILVFIFLMPRAWFRDQPRANSVILMPSGKGQPHFWIEPDLLLGVEGDARIAKANELFRTKTGKSHKVTRVEPLLDSEQEIRGYMAYVTE